MAELSLEIFEVLEKEAKQGYMDMAVVGGFSRWFMSVADDFPAAYKSEAFDLAERYEDASILERMAVYQQCKAFLESLPAYVFAAPEPVKPMVRENINLKVSIEYLKGVGPKRAVLLRNLGLYNMEDVFYNVPRDYQVRGDVLAIGDAPTGENVSIRGKILAKTVITTNRRLKILKVMISDGSGTINAIWYNQHHLEPKMVVGKEIYVYGKFEQRYNNGEFSVLDYELIEAGADLNKKIVPQYSLSGNLTQKSMQTLVEAAWAKCGNSLRETLPQGVVDKHNLMSLKGALHQLHFPTSLDLVEQARKRMAYEEILVLQLAIMSNSLPENSVGIARKGSPYDLDDFKAVLPFELTNAQKRVIDEVFADLEKAEPMTRLVQGDVGSGKTMVAAAALYKNARAGFQGALMAPTEILASQHFQGLAPIFAKLGLRTAFLSGDTSAKERKSVLAGLAGGTIDVIIGTHALFQKNVFYYNLGLAVTDEQHRFGVVQRSTLQQKGKFADMLVMTATPIPRTLALTVYGDLDVSIIDELPPGRQEIETYAIAYDVEERAIGFIKRELDKGRQVYVVCPLVEESEKLELQSAVVVADDLQKTALKEYKVGLLHGKMKPAEKADIMEKFVGGEIQVLVATTVIEVGVNVPNATVMMIRDAERFGLAQLHQLRGRVGRGGEQSYCILLNNAKNAIARERMKTMTSSTDGFYIAEADLKLRGAGEVLGTRQSGIAEMKFANLARDVEIVMAARKDAVDLLASREYEHYPMVLELERKLQYINS